MEISVISGNHEDLYDALRLGEADLVLNDQRRAFSDEYENLVLTEVVCCVEMASHNPLAMRSSVSVEELKNTPCILVASIGQREEERRFYRDIIGFKGGFLFADTLQAARVMTVSNRGIMPVEGRIGDPSSGAVLKRIPLLRGENELNRRYCAFWKKENSGYYVEEFADILKSMF